MQSRVPPAAMQRLRERTESESSASVTAPSASATSTGDDGDGAPLSHLLRLQEPRLSPSLSTLFALYRRATKERQLLLRRSQIPSGAADEAGATRLEYLRYLEEPALLLPDTRHTSAALGLSAARSAVQHGSSAEPVKGGALSSADAQLDAFYVGVATEATDYRVDYAATPEHYVLGVPTDLLRRTTRTTAAADDGTTSCPRRSSVDLSAWVVYDDASGQFLLRRGRAASTSYRAVLEKEVFLAHTYHFDAKRAYDAALAVHRRDVPQRTEGESGPSRPSSCGYALFFFHSSRGGERTFCGAAQHAGVLYPSCYVSYLAEVPTTRMLAAEHRSSAHVPVGGAAVPLSSTPSQRRQERATEGPAQSTASPLFLAVSGKRFHAAAAPREGAETPAAAATSWTVQTDVRRPQPAAPPLSASTAHLSDGQAEEGEAVSGQVLRAQLRAAFREWGAAAAARAGALPLTSSPPRAEGGGSAGAAASTSTLEARLDAERSALLPSQASAWQRGWRLTAASIAVAMPIICDTTMTLRPTDDASSHHRKRPTVADAPLADALWCALYTPDGQLAISSASAGAPAAPCPSNPPTRPPFHCGGGAVLPLAEDRLSAARQRVLLPFFRAPRRVAPSGRDDCGCCPALWRVDEIEAVCGWRTFSEQFLKAFGCFSGLLYDDLYVPLGTRASPYCFSDGSGGDAAVPAWQSPVVWINDTVYVHRVLVPALMRFARHTTAIEKGDLCVYRGVTGAGLAGTMNAAVAVGTHHRHLGTMLQQLQQMPTPELQAWLSAAPTSSLADAEVQRRCGASENCLAFFRGAAVRAVTGEEPRKDISAGLGGSNEVPAAEVVAALRSLTVADIHVVPFVDFLTWASLGSDFSSKALDALRLHADRVRSAFAARDCVMAAKFCLQHPSLLCVEGGGGSTVAVMRCGDSPSAS